MWALKIRAREKWGIFNKRCVDFSVCVQMYAPNHYVEDEMIHFVVVGYVEGTPEKVQEYLSSLQQDEKIVSFDCDGCLFYATYVESAHEERAKAVRTVYNPRFLFLKPVYIDSDGWEEWEVACANREELESFLTMAQNVSNTEYDLLYFKQRPLRNVMMYSVMPGVTQKQREAISLAIENEYYGYPRKTKLVDLAKLMGVSVSTFQFHLAKAEAKLLPKLHSLSEYSDKK